MRLTITLAILATALAASAAPPAAGARPTRAEAVAFLRAAEHEIGALWIARERANWVRATYITEDTEMMAARSEEAVMEASARLAGDAVRFAQADLAPADRRKLELLRLTVTLPPPPGPRLRAELAAVATRMENGYSKGKYCPPRLKGRSKLLISEITGEVLYDRVRRHSLLVRVDSLCYEIFVPSGVAARLRHAPESERPNPVTFYTIYYIDGGLGGGHLTPKLVGFLDPLDREFFEAFTTVPGIGFMKALKCLVRPLSEIALAIERGDTAFLEELPHIGKKTAERVVTELRGKMTKFALARPEAPLALEQELPSELREEALQVLLQLEFSRPEAQRLVSEVFAQYRNLKSVEDFVRKVFERLHPKPE